MQKLPREPDDGRTIASSGGALVTGGAVASPTAAADVAGVGAGNRTTIPCADGVATPTRSTSRDTPDEQETSAATTTAPSAARAASSLAFVTNGRIARKRTLGCAARVRRL